MAPKELTRCNETWTESKFSSFVKSQLRGATWKWPPVSEVYKEARTKRGYYLCNSCKQEVTTTITLNGKKHKNAVVDHITPVVDPSDGFTNWGDFVERLYCEKTNLQVLCRECHTKKGEEERTLRAEQTKLRKDHPKEYSSWHNMNSRCDNPNSVGYQYYGGKGIKVCDAWARSDTNPLGFKNFLTDMQERPDGATLDRVDYNGNYTSENCRWASWKEQARNTSSNNWIDYQGEFLILEDWGIKLGIKPNSILTRLRRGWTVGQSLGLEERPKNLYNGRLNQTDLTTLFELLNEGATQTQAGEALDIDASQVSRICAKFGYKIKSKEERATATARNKKKED